jgi:translation elongation factor EF-1alpha
MRVQVGTVNHYFNRIGVAVLGLTGELQVGDRIHILGHTTDFEQVITSMEINHKKVEAVKPGDDVALKVRDKVRGGDVVYKVDEET